MILGINISTPEVTLKKETGRSVGLTDLKPGQVIRAKVLGMISKTEATLLLGGQKIIAKTDLPLTQGQEIQLKLIREKGMLSFKMIQPSVKGQQPLQAGQGQALARFASGMLGLKKLGSEPPPVIKEILSQLALKSGERNDAFLPRIIKNQGLMLENKIATLVIGSGKSGLSSEMNQLVKQDLKAAVLNLLSQDIQGETAGKETIARTLTSAAGALENLQTLNTQTGDSNRFILPFPVLTGDQFDFGQLLINTGRDKGEEGEKKEDRVTQLAFLLNMTQLGSLRADFSILKKAITGRFLLENKETCDYMKSLMPDLKERLGQIDYQAARMDCHVAEPKELSSDALIQSVAGPDEIRGLDLVI